MDSYLFFNKYMEILKRVGVRAVLTAAMLSGIAGLGRSAPVVQAQSSDGGGNNTVIGCYLDGELGVRSRHSFGNPPYISVDVLDSCAQDGQLGHLDTDGSIDGYTKRVLPYDYTYIDKSGARRTLKAGTAVYESGGPFDVVNK